MIQKYWDDDDHEVSFQFSRSPEDGRSKVRRAISEGVEVILICGGDGMINTLGRELIGSGVAMGVVPAGSGNGFARHFGIPLNPIQAIPALRRAQARAIDVGVMNQRPFFVTCSLASEAAIAQHVDKSPIRGLLPYLWAAPLGFVEHRSQAFQVQLDDGPVFTVDSAMLFTVANVTQFGGGAQIAPTARADDGMLELVYAERRDMAKVLPRWNKLFNGTLDEIPEIHTARFKTLRVSRKEPGPIQVDGETLAPVADIRIDVLQAALSVLVP